MIDERRSMEAKHTPGPWTVDADEGVVAIRGDGGQKIIAWMEWAKETIGWTPEDEANLNLIQDAPKLLEALEKAYILIDKALKLPATSSEGIGSAKQARNELANALARREAQS